MSSPGSDIRHRKKENTGDSGDSAMPEQHLTEPSKTSRVNLQKIRDKAEKLRTDLANGFEKQLRELLDDFVEDVERIQAPSSGNGAFGNNNSKLLDSQYANSNGSVTHAHHRKGRGELSDKVYISRRSVLSELLETDHIRTIYHIFVAILIVFMLNTLVYDFMDQGRVVLDFQMMVWTFGKFPMVISIWLYMAFSTSLIVYPAFMYWSYYRKPSRVYWFDYVMLGLYIVYQILFLILPVRTICLHQLPIASTVVVATEQVRLLMKSHAFVRQNIPRVLSHSKDTAKEGDEPVCPDFSKYLYFLFAPTLVYRDSYPRNPGPIRWNYVVSNFTQVLASLFYIYYIFERFCIPVFNNFNQEFLTPRRIIVAMFGCMLPGTLVLFIGFFAILHSWLNAFAEMLRFSDRLFYKDWWNSSSFSNYYRTWNTVVHDWLYTYIYKDVCHVIGTANRGVAMAAVFILSAVFHEYILSISFGFCYPVLFIMFAGAGFAFIFVPSKSQRSGNVFMWVALFTGNGILMCLYSMEYYARQQCPSNTDSYFDFFIPRSWTCDFNATASLTTAGIGMQGV